MGLAKMFYCDQCKKRGSSEWEGEPNGWVRLEVNAVWDGNNYHFCEGKAIPRSFCSIKCLVGWMEREWRNQYQLRRNKLKHLTRILKEEHRRAGLYLEDDDHNVCLMRRQNILARFSATGATVESILAEADRWMVTK